MDNNIQAGGSMHDLMRKLWPICRSITGDGVRETLAILEEKLPGLAIEEVETGTKCFDWSIPKEWNIQDAYIKNPEGKKVVDFSESNLHVLNYSAPIKKTVSLDELQEHLHSLPDQPDAIPYVTSYYNETWGFCLTENVRSTLKSGDYEVCIDSELKAGSLTYGELILPGKTNQEILLSTYVCHPSMANNELSGPCVTAALAEWLQSNENYYTYRILFIPETIGAICYLSKHLDELKEKVVAGYVITCVGDERAWSFMPSRKSDSLSDKIARHVLKNIAPDYIEYSFLERGSDERQYCAPGIDLPIASIMRSKYVTYPEYHTSLDNLELVTPRGLAQSFGAYQKVIEALENDCIPTATVLGEPKMSDRGLRPTIGKLGSANSGRSMMNILAYADGTHDLIDLAEIIGEPAWEVKELVDTLIECELLTIEKR